MLKADPLGRYYLFHDRNISPSKREPHEPLDAAESFPRSQGEPISRKEMK